MALPVVWGDQYPIAASGTYMRSACATASIGYYNQDYREIPVPYFEPPKNKMVERCSFCNGRNKIDFINCEHCGASG